jgi:myo-inositol-1(or 4)-monophosphatase
VIDRRCEDIVFEELEGLAAAGASFKAISEERGEVSFGAGGDARVVIDPIDGSLNARRTLPSHSLSIAVAAGPSMADVEFGYVYDFGAGEEFIGRRGEGAELDGAPIAVGADAEKLERVVGSIAITACYLAAGRFDGMLSLRPCRSVDAAAAQLIVREAGGRIAFGDLALDGAGLGLDVRYPLLGAAGPQGLQLLEAAQ